MCQSNGSLGNRPPFVAALHRPTTLPTPSLCHPSPARRIDSGVVDPGTKVALQSTVLSSAAPAGGNASAVAAAAALPLPLPIPGGGMVVVQQVQPAPVLQQQGAAVAASAAALPIASPAELKVSRRASSECLCTDQRMALVEERMAPCGGFFERQPFLPWCCCRACSAAATPR